MDAGKAEIYRYVRDQHDKHIAASESLITRFGNIRLLAGLLLTVISFSITVVAKTIENAHHLWSRAVAILPLFALAVALFYMVKALLAIPKLVGNIDLYIPGADQSTILESFQDEEPNADEILEDLSSNYLEAIDHNIRANQSARQNLGLSVELIRKGLFFTIAFLALTIMSNLAVSWRFGGK
jgi:hypothetical protein